MHPRNTRLQVSELDAPDGEYSALILAKAGLVHLDWNARISSDILPPMRHGGTHS